MPSTKYLPSVLRAEVKFTTSPSVALPERERSALRVRELGELGALAILFWQVKSSIDGRWLLLDVNDAFRTRRGVVTVDAERVVRTAKQQRQLKSLQQHIEVAWPRFLRGFMKEAKQGHAVLQRELKTEHATGRIEARLQGDEPLKLEHGQRIEELIAQHGAGPVGHIFQDLLAYLIALVGYRHVQTNPVGVPDIELSGLRAENEHNDLSTVSLELTADQLTRLARICRTAGDEELLAIIETGCTERQK